MYNSPFSLINEQLIYVPEIFRPIGKVKTMTRHTPEEKAGPSFHFRNFFFQTEAKSSSNIRSA